MSNLSVAALALFGAFAIGGASVGVVSLIKQGKDAKVMEQNFKTIDTNINALINGNKEAFEKSLAELKAENKKNNCKLFEAERTLAEKKTAFEKAVAAQKMLNYMCDLVNDSAGGDGGADILVDKHAIPHVVAGPHQFARAGAAAQLTSAEAYQACFDAVDFVKSGAKMVNVHRGEVIHRLAGAGAVPGGGAGAAGAWAGDAGRAVTILNNKNFAADKVKTAKAELDKAQADFDALNK